MNSYAYPPVDPYAYSPKKQPPRERRHNPLDPREPYKTYFTEAPATRPFPRTGSLFYRCRVFDGRLMTLKEQRFEEFVDDIQARHDELSEIREWRRLKNHEEKAICLYHEVGEDLDTFSMRMRTHDQQEMEYHCQRKKQKDIDLDPIEASRKSNVRAQEYIQQYIGAREAEKRARDQERIRNNAVAEFKAGVQQASQQSELKQSKPEKNGNTSHPVSSFGTGPSRQQKQKTKPSKEEVRRQFRDQVRALPATTNRTTMPLRTANVRPVPPATAALAREARPKELNVAVPAAGEDSSKAELAGYQPRVVIMNGVHCPKRGIPIKKGPVLKKVDLGSSSEAEQSLPRNNGPGSDALQEHPIAESREQPSTNPYAQQNSSEGSGPLETPMEEQNVAHNIGQEHPVAESSKQPSTNQSAQQNPSEEPTPASPAPPSPPETPINGGLDNGRRLLELEWDIYGKVMFPNQWDRMTPARRTDPFINSLICEHLERWKAKKSRVGEKH